MADHVSAARRSEIMGSIRSRDTAPEMAVRRAAHSLGLRFRLHGRGLPGRPDLVFPRWKTVVFVNGCFWHCHSGCKRATVPKSNTAFWGRKLVTNARRDAANYARLRALGWRVVVIWQCEVTRVPESDRRVAARLRSYFPAGAIRPHTPQRRKRSAATKLGQPGPN